MLAFFRGVEATYPDITNSFLLHLVAGMIWIFTPCVEIIKSFRKQRLAEKEGAHERNYFHSTWQRQRADPSSFGV